MKYPIPFPHIPLASDTLDQIERSVQEARKSMAEFSLTHRPSGQFRGKPLYEFRGPDIAVGIDCGPHIFVMEIGKDGEPSIHKINKGDLVKP